MTHTKEDFSFAMTANMARYLESFQANTKANVMLPSMTINQDSKTPYTDATQVRRFCKLYLLSELDREREIFLFCVAPV